MIKEIVKKWDTNKKKIEEWFKLNHPDSYREIVEKLFELVINDSEFPYENFNIKEMVVIDHGDWQGTQIFIIHKDVYQPDVDDYLVTDTYYGSCSGCDTLESITMYSEDLPTDEQVSDYMTLALHLVQKMRWLSYEM